MARDLTRSALLPIRSWGRVPGSPAKADNGKKVYPDSNLSTGGPRYLYILTGSLSTWKSCPRYHITRRQTREISAERYRRMLIYAWDERQALPTRGNPGFQKTSFCFRISICLRICLLFSLVGFERNLSRWTYLYFSVVLPKWKGLFHVSLFGF